MASAGIQAGLGLLQTGLKLGLSALLQHSARLQGAKTENAGIEPVVNAFDADLAAIVAAYNNGQADAATCVNALRGLDQNLYTNLRGNTVSPSGAPIPGAAWSDSTGVAGRCDKTCTAGCCVYFGDLGPVLSMASVAMGGGYIRAAQWGVRDPRYKAVQGGATIQVPEVFASKYGLADRPGYTISVVAPPPAAKVQEGLQSTLASFFGEASAPPVVSTLANEAPVASGSLGGAMPGFASVANSVTLGGFAANPSLILVATGALFLIILAALFTRR